MWPALKAHHDTPTPGGLSPHQILFGRDPLGRGLPLSGDGMAMDAKDFFARQEATARAIRQQLEKEHAERQKFAPSSTPQKFTGGRPGVGDQTPPYGHPPHQNLVHTRRGGPQDW